MEFPFSNSTRYKKAEKQKSKNVKLEVNAEIYRSQLLVIDETWLEKNKNLDDIQSSSRVIISISVSVKNSIQTYEPKKLAKCYKNSCPDKNFYYIYCTAYRFQNYFAFYEEQINLSSMKKSRNRAENASGSNKSDVECTARVQKSFTQQ